ncbi:hypothetical protein [Streptomyces zhihengii]
MFHRHARAACAGAVAVGALVLASLQGTASAAPTAADPPARSAARTLGTAAAAPELLDAMRRDLGLTLPQAERRLVYDAEAALTL